MIHVGKYTIHGSDGDRDSCLLMIFSKFWSPSTGGDGQDMGTTSSKALNKWWEICGKKPRGNFVYLAGNVFFVWEFPPSPGKTNATCRDSFCKQVKLSLRDMWHEIKMQQSFDIGKKHRQTADWTYPNVASHQRIPPNVTWRSKSRFEFETKLWESLQDCENLYKIASKMSNFHFNDWRKNLSAGKVKCWYLLGLGAAFYIYLAVRVPLHKFVTLFIIPSIILGGQYFSGFKNTL